MITNPLQCSCYGLIGACRLPSIDWTLSIASWYVQIEYPVSTRQIESVSPVHLNYEQRSRRWLPMLSTVALLSIDWSLSIAFWSVQFEYWASTRQIESVRPVLVDFEQRSRRWLTILSTVVMLLLDWGMSMNSGTCNSNTQYLLVQSNPSDQYI
jgi:hypothetical protein